MAAKCTSPTSVKVNKPIQIYNQPVTLSWSGARPPDGGVITGYDIYRSTSSGSGYTRVVTNCTNNSYTFLAPSTRGTFYYYKIVTKGSNPYTDSELNDSPVASLKANTLPGVPSVAPSQTKISWRGSSNIEFRATPGSDADNQQLSLFYQIGGSGNKVRFTSPLTLSLSDETTVYFYTFDGLEYSENSTPINLTKNTEPSIEVNSGLTNVETYTALGDSGTGGRFQLAYSHIIEPNVTTDRPGNITVGVEYYYSNGDERFTTSGEGYVYKTMATISRQYADINLPLGTFDIHKYISTPISDKNLHWRIYFRLNDGVDVSDWIYYPSQASGQYYTIARASEAIKISNKHSNEDKDVVGTNSGEVWRDLRFKLYNDTSISGVKSVSAIISSGNLKGTELSLLFTSDVYGEDDEFRYINITLQDFIPGGVSIDISANLTDSNGYITKTTQGTVTETKEPFLNNDLNYGAPVIKPFTDTGTYEVNISWPFTSSSESLSDALAAYNCNTDASGIKIVFSSDNLADGSDRNEKTGLTWSKSNDALTTTMDKATAYTWGSLGIDTYGGRFTYWCRIEITNLFGKTYSSTWFSEVFDFNEAPASAEIQSIEWSSDNENWSTLTTGQAIQEGMYLRLNCIFGIYSKDDIRVSILVEDNLQKREINCIDPDYNIQPTQTYRVTSSNGVLVRPEPNTSGNPIGSIRYGKEFNSNTVVIGQNIDGVNTWVYYDQEEGYVTGRYLVPTPEVKGITTPFIYPRNLITYPGTRLNAPAQNVKSFVYHITNEITNAANKKWSIQVSNSTGMVESAQVATPVLRQTAPNLTLSSCTVSEEIVSGESVYTFDYAYSMTDGGGGTLTHYLYDGTNEITSSLQSSSSTIIATITGWTVKTISVKTVSVVTGLITNTKTYYSNGLIVYKATPTIAYRPNQIGINTDAPDSGTTVDIYQTTGKPEIRIHGVTDPALIPTQFRINATTGQIGFYLYDSQTDTYVLQHTLDLMHGTLT